MILLAFESSAKAASAALFADGRLLSEIYAHNGLTHSRTLLPMAGELLKLCEYEPGQVDAVAAAAGPGSFTGVRIGVAAAKGFAWGGRLPCYGVSTLEAMAWGAAWQDGLVCPVMDARRGQVYTALFRIEGGTVKRLQPDRALSLEMLDEAQRNFDETIILVGDGAELCYNTLGKRNGRLRLAPEHLRQQRAAGVGLAALAAIAAGASGDAAALVPNYLRLSQAERERLEKQKGLENNGNRTCI